MVREARKLSVRICRPADEAYEFLSLPENFARWASSTAVPLRFTERNRFGVLDYAVRLPGGASAYLPLRVAPVAGGCELSLTLFRRPGASDAQYAADAERAMRDLLAAKRILEAGKSVAPVAAETQAPQAR